MFVCASSASQPPRIRAPGLRPRGDESDQSDQSTEITVIREVRRRAPGHSEFTHPTQARDKAGQEWQTFGLKTLILCKERTSQTFFYSRLGIVFFKTMFGVGAQPLIC